MSSATSLLCLILCLHCLHCSALDKGKTSRREDFTFAYKPLQDVRCNTPIKPLPSPEELKKKVGSIFANKFNDLNETLSNSPGGVVVSFVYKDEVIWTGSFGLKDMKNPSLGVPDKDTRFRIGSVTKLFTALQTLMMRDSGLIKSLDDDISFYYPEFKVQNPFQTERGITFRQLLSHMSGLPRNSPCKGLTNQTGCNTSDAEMLENIAYLRLMYPPGTQPVYSNLGFALLGKVLTRIAKAKSWDELLNKMILQPLGMKNTGNSYEDYDPKKFAKGYYPDGSEADFIDIGWDESAGQSYSSTADLAKLMSLVFSSEKSSKEQLVDGETLREWIQPAYLYANRVGFSFPWEVLSLGYMFHSKSGAINGFNARFQMLTVGKLGFIVLRSCHRCDSQDVIMTRAMSTLVYIAIFGLIGEDIAQTPPLPPHPQDYEGNYTAIVGRDKREVTIQVYLKDNVLYSEEINDKAVLIWHGNNTFQISDSMLLIDGFDCPTLSSGRIGVWVYFQKDSEGQVVSLTRPGLTYGAVYKRQK